MLIIVALLLLEGISYGVFKLAGFEPYRPAVIENPHHPYLGWVHAPNITVHARNCSEPEVSLLETDADGFSVTPHYSFPEPALRIVVTGGSTMFGVGSSTAATSVPALLEKLIVEELGIKAEVHNIAVRGYQSFQEMLALLRFATEYDFDLALAISGRNDSYHAAQERSRQSALLPGNPHRASEFVRSIERDEFVQSGVLSALRSCCYTVDLLAQIAGLDANRGRARTPGRLPSSKRGQQIGDFTDVRRRAGITRTNYALMDRVARENGAGFIMLLQPTLYTKAAVAESEQACSDADPANPFGMFHKEFEARFYAAYLDLEQHYRLIDARTALDIGTSQDVYYVDKAHYNDRGAELLAGFVFGQIRPVLEEIIAAKAVRPSPDRQRARQYKGGAIVHGEDVLSGRAETAGAP